MFYFAVFPSAINPHCCALEASALACLPQVGIQLGAGAISFTATVRPPQSFVKKMLYLSQRRKQRTLGKFKKMRREGKKRRRERRRERRRDEQNYCGKNLQSCCQRRYKVSIWWVTMLWKICIGDKGFVSFLCLFNELHLSTPYPQLFN